VTVASRAPRSGFPTLAEHLAEPSPQEETARTALTVVLEGLDDAARVVATVPVGSLVVTVRGSWLAPGPDGEAGAPSVRTQRTLGGLRDLVRARDHDVLLVSDGRLLTPAALEQLRSGLAADSACATVSVVERPSAAVPGLPPPGVVAPHGGAVLVRRDHLVLALDEATLAGRDEVRLIRRAGDHGFVAEVLATLLRPGFVHRSVGRDVDPPSTGQSPPRRTIGRATARIALDGRCLAQPLSGTQVQLLGLVGGLVRDGAEVAVLRPSELHPTAASEVARLGVDVPFVERSGLGRPDVFHRPFQVGSLHELADCLSLAERMVLTHQDMLRDRTPAYANGTDAWHDYRRTTEAALSSADEVGFFSRHAAADAASDGAVELDRATVVHLGVDHLSGSAADTVMDPLRGRPYLLVMGNAYWHKNRVFAIRLLRWLIERAGWDGGLVLAGEDPRIGSSVAAEQLLVRETSSLRDRVADLGRVSEAERVALYRRACLVVFPSLYEGFGLIPFEAASLGTACVYAHRSSMRELLPDKGALPSFDLDEAGPFVLSLLESDPARKRVVAEIAAVASWLTWDRAAAGYLEVYGRALAREPRTISRLLLGVDPSGRRQPTQREALLLDVYRRRRGFRLAVDGLLRTGSVALHGARRIRRKERS
jgi:glycosyltransferase involved in cell wall biosynthesis